MIHSRPTMQGKQWMIGSSDQYFTIAERGRPYFRNSIRGTQHASQAAASPNHLANLDALDRLGPICSFDHRPRDEAPRRIELRPTQLVRLGRVEQRRCCAIGPCQAALRWFIKRPERRRVDGKNAAVALYHYIAGVGSSLSHQGQSAICPTRRRRRPADNRPHPLCTGPRLSEPPPRIDDPRQPVTRRRNLLCPPPEQPIPFERFELCLGQAIKNLRPVPFWQRGEQFGLRQAHGRLPLRLL